MIQDKIDIALSHIKQTLVYYYVGQDKIQDIINELVEKEDKDKREKEILDTLRLIVEASPTSQKKWLELSLEYLKQDLSKKKKKKKGKK